MGYDESQFSQWLGQKRHHGLGNVCAEFHADSMAYEGAEILEMDKKLSDSRTIQCDTNTNNISFNEGLSLRVVSGKDRERRDTRPRDALP